MNLGKLKLFWDHAELDKLSGCCRYFKIQIMRNEFCLPVDARLKSNYKKRNSKVLLSFCLPRPVSLIQNSSSSCLGKILLCTDGLTVAFWFKLLDNSSDSQRLLYAAEDQTDISITAQSNQITAVFFISSNPLLVSFNVTLHQWHHVTFTWAQSEDLVAVVDFVHWLKSGPFIPVTPVTEEVPLTIGQAPTNIAVYMSHVVVYERFLTPSQIQRIAKCTDLVAGEGILNLFQSFYGTN